MPYIAHTAPPRPAYFFQNRERKRPVRFFQNRERKRPVSDFCR
jgi:hypothetical protein